MKHPHPGEMGAVRELGNSFGKTDITKSSAAPQESRVIPFPGVSLERSHDAREAWLAMVAAITARDSHILAGGAISDTEYRRLASVVVMARDTFERSYLDKGAA